MASPAGTLEHLAIELAGVLGRVTNRFGDDGALDTFDELGVHFPDEFLTATRITAARQTVSTVGGELQGLTESLVSAIASGDDGGIAAASLALLTQCGRVAAAFPELVTALRAEGPTLAGITQAQIDDLVADLPTKVGDLLLADLLQLSKPVGAVLEIFGVLERTFVPGDPADDSRPPYEATSVHLDRLVPAITDPVNHLNTLYGWGTPAFDAARLLAVLESALAALGFPVLLVPGTATDPPSLQFFAFDLGPTTDGQGLALRVVLPGDGVGSVDVPLSPPTWTAQVALTGKLPADTGGDIRPPFDITLRPPSAIEAGLTVGVKAEPPEPFLLFGAAGGTRLEFASAQLDAGVVATYDTGTGTATASPTLDGEIRGGKLVVDASGGDGFLSTLLSGVHIETEFGVGFSFAPETGLRFHGSGALEIQIPVHVEIGPVDVEAIYLRATLDGATVPIELSAGFGAHLGPLQASVDRMGLLATLSFPAGGGNLGPADLALRLQAAHRGRPRGQRRRGHRRGVPEHRPRRGGVRRRARAGVRGVPVAQGHRPHHHEDAGRLDRLLAARRHHRGVPWRAAARVRLHPARRRRHPRAEPGDAPGRDHGGCADGAIESVMFPHDVVANAPRIISDLKSFFPPEQGRFVIGPMAKVGWGTPPLISVSLGVIIEIPGNIAILGVIKVALPTEDEAILLLQVNFAGAIEFDKKRLYFFASLYDSRVLTITIAGEMGLLVAFGDQPDFVAERRGLPPRVQAAAAAVPEPAADLDQPARHERRPDRRPGLLRGHEQHRAVRREGGAVLRVQRDQRRGSHRLRRAVPVLAVQVRRADLRRGVRQGLRRRCLQRSPGRRPLRSHPVADQGQRVDLVLLLLHPRRHRPDLGRATATPPCRRSPCSRSSPASWPSPRAGGPARRPAARPGSASGRWRTRRTASSCTRSARCSSSSARFRSTSPSTRSATSARQTSPGAPSRWRRAAWSRCPTPSTTSRSPSSRTSATPRSCRCRRSNPSTPGSSWRPTALRWPRSAPCAAAPATRRSSSTPPDGRRTASSPTTPLCSATSSAGRASPGRRWRRPSVRCASRSPTRSRVTGDTFVVASTRDNTAVSAVFGSQAQARAHLDDLLAADPFQFDELHVIPAMEVAS